MPTAKVTRSTSKVARPTVKKGVRVRRETAALVEGFRSFNATEGLFIVNLGSGRRTFSEVLDVLVPLGVERAKQLQLELAGKHRCTCARCAELDEESGTPGVVDQLVAGAVVGGGR